MRFAIHPAISPIGDVRLTSGATAELVRWARSGGLLPRLLPLKGNPQQVYFRETTTKPLICWRKGWDSNPRYPCGHAGFQDRCLKPLGHPSNPLKSFSSSKRRVRPLPRLPPLGCPTPPVASVYGSPAGFVNATLARRAGSRHPTFDLGAAGFPIRDFTRRHGMAFVHFEANQGQ